MKTTFWKNFLRLSVVGMLALGGCTDERNPQVAFQAPIDGTPPQQVPLTAVAEVQYNGDVTQVMKMVVHGGSLYATGKPFALFRADISNPALPVLIFAAKDTMLSTFAPVERFGPWLPDLYANGALAVEYPHVYMSGANGLSIADVSNLNTPVEVNRIPPWNGNQATKDERFVYTGMVVNGQTKRVYGFRQLDNIFHLGTNFLPQMQLFGSQPYENPSECCVTKAVKFDGRIYVSTRSKLLVYEETSGALNYLGANTTLQPVNLTATPNYLYIHHRPQNAGATYPAGVYRVGRNGSLSDYYPIDPVGDFAVDDADTHMYANVGNTSVTVFRFNY